MNSRKMYRVELTKTNSLAEQIAIAACLSNGSKYISLQDMESIVKVDLIRYPTINDNVSVTVAGNVLTIDKGTENILTVTEVEIMELETPQLTSKEARDILDEIVPTLNRQGISDGNSNELLN